MKKFKIAAALIALATAANFAGCSACDETVPPDDDKPPIVNPPSDFISVAVTQESVSIKDYEVEGFNFARYFRISDNNASVPSSDYIDASAVEARAGEYVAVCNYKGKSASITVKVIASECTLTVSKNSVKIKSTEVDSYDFKSLFTLTVDGKRTAVTDKMVTSNVAAEAGSYTYTVTFFSVSETVEVTVVDANAIEIINSYGVLELTADELRDFDYTTLFSIYVGGEAERVLLSYIDASALDAPEEGQTYPVTIAFEKNGIGATSTAEIKVVGQTQISITANNIVTYPNGENIDLKTLFTVKDGNRVIEVTDDMVTGTVDYSKEGDNAITLNYGGRTAVATVTIKLGVIIGYATSDTVIAEVGTDAESYDFGADFTVIINGIRFTDLPRSYFDLSGVDFSKEGEFTVKIKVPYNTKPLGLSGVNFDYFEKEITYEVVDKKVEYTLNVLQQNLLLPAGTVKYNVYDNLSVTIDGIRRKLIDDKDKLDITACYAQIVSPPVDFTSVAEQTVEIDVYVFGPDADPVRVAYALRVDNGVTVTGRERVIFSGTTVYARELFTIEENGESVTVTDDMVSGKIDLFNAGVYFVTATYKGVTAQSKAVVLDAAMAGTYKTLLSEIEPYEEEEDDGDYEWDQYAVDPTYSSTYAATLKNLTIDTDGEMFVGSDRMEIVSIIDDRTFSVKLYTNDYIFRYDDGIITLDPDNSLHMSYTDRRRPLVYFHSDKWTVECSIEVNSSTTGCNVLQTNSLGNTVVGAGSYTLDFFKLKAADGTESWYGMKTTFISKLASNVYYGDEVFGFARFAPDFENKEGFVSSVGFGGETYGFTMTSGSKAMINKNTAAVSEYAGMAFRGTVDGNSAIFAVAANDRISLTVDNKKVFDLTPNEQVPIKNGGPAYDDNTWLVYDMSVPYSYRFRLDKATKTFTLDAPDDLFGRYEFGTVCFFFDGFGTGEVNFDTSSRYLTTAFSYKRNGANVEITYLNPAPDFSYGTTAKFLFSDYKNVLTVREITGIDLVGKQFVSAQIYDGAIVTVGNLVLGKGVGDKELFDGISIVTKDGALSVEQMKGVIAGTKTKYVDVSRVSFGKAGFYQLIINIPVNGSVKSSYYAVQVLDSLYTGNRLLGRYSQSAVSGATLNVDEFGRISGVFGGISFSGSARLGATSFTATAQCEKGAITITGELIEDGIIRVTARGALMFTDCLTTGTVKTAASSDIFIRSVTAGGRSVWFLSDAYSALGKIVTVEGNFDTLGALLKFTDGSSEWFVKIIEWGNISEMGKLVRSDAFRGTYTCSLEFDLVLDGFGKATVGAKTGDYVVYGSSVTVVFTDVVKVYKISTAQKTYTLSNIKIDETLLEGKSFSADYSVLPEFAEQSYSVTTVFEFKTGGKVTVKSVSDDFSVDGMDKYNPLFVTGDGEEGTFTVTGNKITVTVKGIKFVFTFNDAVGLNAIKCSSTDVSSSSAGYFKVGTEFTRV